MWIGGFKSRFNIDQDQLWEKVPFSQQAASFKTSFAGYDQQTTAPKFLSLLEQVKTAQYSNPDFGDLHVKTRLSIY